MFSNGQPCMRILNELLERPPHRPCATASPLASGPPTSALCSIKSLPGGHFSAWVSQHPNGSMMLHLDDACVELSHIQLYVHRCRKSFQEAGFVTVTTQVQSVVLCSTESYSKVPYGTVRCGTVRYGTVGRVRYGRVGYGMVRNGTAWYGTARQGIS